MVAASFSTLSPLSGLVELDHLAVATGGDIVLAREVLALFSAQAQALTAALAGLSPQAGVEAHKLKGSAAAIGAVAVLEAVGRFEVVMGQGSDPDAALGALRAAVADVCAAIAMLPSSPSP